VSTSDFSDILCKSPNLVYILFNPVTDPKMTLLSFFPIVGDTWIILQAKLDGTSYMNQLHPTDPS